MRAKLWLGLMTIAVAAPFGAHADDHADFRDSAGNRPVDTYLRRDFHPVDTYVPRDFRGRAAPGAAAPVAAPEMNVGLAATGFTLLFGGVAILRGRRARAQAQRNRVHTHTRQS